MALTLNTNYVSAVGPDQRLRTDQVQDQVDVHVAREGLGGRVLSWLGQLPLLRNLDAVRAHVQTIKMENQAALETFIQTLSPQYRDGALRDAGLDLNNPKPLTMRLIRQVEQSVERQQQAEPVHVSFAELKAQGRIPDATPPCQTVPSRAVSTPMAPAVPVDPQALLSELDKALGSVNRPEYAAPNSITHARFSPSSVPTAGATQVGQLAVNRIAIEGRPAALAGQYPGDSQRAMGAYLRMVVEQGCSSLMVLAEDKKIGTGNSPMLAYFKDGKRTYDDVTITSTTPKGGEIDLDGLHVHRYELTIAVPGREPFTLPALHVMDWEDHKTVKDAAQLEKLAQLAREVDDEGKALREPIYANVAAPEALPMIHCRGGVGRTGTLIAAMELVKPDSKASLERIIADERATRNHRMAEDKGQREQLVELAQRQGKAVLTPSEPVYVNF
ncbi:type III secretion system effector BopA family protein [Chromobacterium sp. ASV23]|uniref:type III secretion system effector BopA family protein n=1 Tax=Chromobacterium sp. ASV23 TaxID=2795110 RepID=UPI0018EE2E3D|nr:type III secretion system effector BopA family protein [Chromobacterium sp. ASV23]